MSDNLVQRFIDPRITITNEIVLLGKREGAYGLICSQHIYDMLEMRCVVMRDTEVPIMNTIPTAVDRTMRFNEWKFCARDEWERRSKNR